MADRLVTVASFNSPVEADIARGLLSEAGIESYLADEALVGNFWALLNAVGGVKLQVAEADLERAHAALQPEPDPEPQPSPAGSLPAARPATGWHCARCGSQVDSGFDVCWNCGTSRDGQADPNFVAEPFDDEPDEPSSEPGRNSPDDWQSLPEAIARVDANPFSSPRAPLREDTPAVEPPPEETEHGDDLAQRAMRGAIIGLMVCPLIMNLVSVCFLVQLAVHNYPLSQRGKRHYYFAWVFNILAAPLSFVMRGPLTNLMGWLR